MPRSACSSEPPHFRPSRTGSAPGFLPIIGATLIYAGKLDEANLVFDEAQVLASAADDEWPAARALVERQWLAVRRASPGATDAVPEIVDGVTVIFERVGDEHGLSRAWQLRALAHWSHGRISSAAGAWERAAEHAC